MAVSWCFMNQKRFNNNRWKDAMQSEYDAKTNSNGSMEKFKARLVIKDFSQVKGVGYLISLAARMNLKVMQMDTATAFLQGRLEEKEIFMKQPEGFVIQ